MVVSDRFAAALIGLDRRLDVKSCHFESFRRPAGAGKQFQRRGSSKQGTRMDISGKFETIEHTQPGN
jgi:hypothetical protein